MGSPSVFHPWEDTCLNVTLHFIKGQKASIEYLIRLLNLALYLCNNYDFNWTLMDRIYLISSLSSLESCMYAICSDWFLLSLSFKLKAYTGAPPTDEKEKVIWVRFEKADINGKWQERRRTQYLATAPCTPLKEIIISQVTFYLFQFFSFFFHLKYLKQVCIQTFTSSNFIHVLPLMCAALLARFNLY